jgi:hypothetical protein
MLIEDLFDKLQDFDTLYILELLEITTEELLDRFSDVVEDRATEIMEQIGWN